MAPRPIWRNWTAPPFGKDPTLNAVPPPSGEGGRVKITAQLRVTALEPGHFRQPVQADETLVVLADADAEERALLVSSMTSPTRPPSHGRLDHARNKVVLVPRGTTGVQRGRRESRRLDDLLDEQTCKASPIAAIILSHQREDQ